jgi:hypothetical protein
LFAQTPRPKIKELLKCRIYSSSNHTKTSILIKKNKSGEITLP